MNIIYNIKKYGGIGMGENIFRQKRTFQFFI